jgi:hypothetical protein
METWRLLDIGPRPVDEDMALDEVVLIYSFRIRIHVFDWAG